MRLGLPVLKVQLELMELLVLLAQQGLKVSKAAPG